VMSTPMLRGNTTSRGGGASVLSFQAFIATPSTLSGATREIA
jgi:hypothetical protein